MPVEADAAGPVDVALVVKEGAVLPKAVGVVLADEMSFAPHTPFCTAGPRLDLR